MQYVIKLRKHTAGYLEHSCVRALCVIGSVSAQESAHVCHLYPH